MENLDERVAALEVAFAEIKKLKGIPGSRGAAGPIDAAVANAREALAQDLTETKSKFAELQRIVSEFDGKLDSRIRQKIDDAAATLKQRTDDFRHNIEEEIAAIVIKILQDYWVLDSECRVLDANQRPVKK